MRQTGTFLNLARSVAAAGCLALMAACSGSSTSTTSLQAVRTYQATASVGDFLTLSVNPNTNTITYKNYTNGQTGTVAYAVQADGGYAITTPNGGLLNAYEIPGFALVASADNTGSQADTTALVTAILQAPISMSWLEGKTFNFMQWRTSLGGMEVGTVAIDGSGTVNTSSYWPFGAMQVALSVGQTPSAWGSNTFPTTSFTASADGNSLALTDQNGTDTIFATQGGFFVVDNPNGSIISVPQAGSAGFSAGAAGTYQALAFTKNATLGNGSNSETGTGTVAGCTLALSSAGLLTVTDANGNVQTSQTLQPVADVPSLLATGTGQLPNPCPGLFTYEVANGSLKQDVYLEFINQAILFCSFSYDPTQTGPNPVYSYYYGVALKQ